MPGLRGLMFAALPFIAGPDDTPPVIIEPREPKPREPEPDLEPAPEFDASFNPLLDVKSAHTPKPKTAEDRERLALAEEKRQRKAAKRLAS